MSSNRIIIPFVDPDAGETTTYWIVLKDGATLDDLVSFEEAAEFLDKLYDRDPCIDQEPPVPTGEDEEQDKPDAEKFLEDAAAFLQTNSSSCNIEPDGGYEARILVARSHQTEPYKLILDNGEVLNTVKHTEQKTEHLSVKRQSSYTLTYPVTGEFFFEWTTLVYDEDGTGQATPTISGSTINFGREVTGSFFIKYTTEYDIVTVEVYAPIAEVGQSQIPQPEKCEVIAFYHGIVEEYTINPPDDADNDEDDLDLCGKDTPVFPPDGVTCYDKVTYHTRCKCSETSIDTSVAKEYRPCPRDYNCAWGETCEFQIGSKSVTSSYVSCPDEEYLEGTVSDPEYFLEKCCSAPWYKLPPCKNISGVFGSKAGGLDPAIRDNYPGAYFVAVGPGVGPCGEREVTFNVAGHDCCEDVEDMEWDEENSASMVPGIFHVLGGKGEYLWRVSGGNGQFSFHPYYILTEVLGGAWVQVYDLGSACGSGEISVSDTCGNFLRRYIQAIEGEWVIDGDPLDGHDTQSLILGCGWSIISVGYCCSGPISICYIGDPGPSGNCYEYYAAGIAKAAEYYDENEKQNERYKIRRTSCTGHRTCYSNCYGYCDVSSASGSPGTCTHYDDVSGLEVDVCGQQSCWWGTWTGLDCGGDDETDTLYFAVGFGSIREEWVCPSE